jgi:O-antigen/teichoic acid export membrane protein
MKQIKSLSIYGFTIFFNTAISFASFSLLTHYLTEVDYGIINLYSSFLIFLSPFIGVGTQFVLGVDFFKMDELHFRKHFTNTIYIPIVSTVVFTLLLLILHSYVEHFIHVSFVFVLFLPLACMMTVFSDIILTLIRDKGRHKLFSIYSISKNLVEIALTIFLIIGLGLKWQGRLTSSILALIIMMLVTAFIIKRWNLYTGSFDKQDARKSFLTGLPFVPERLAIFILVYSDRFFINHYSGTADVGLYSSGAQIAVIMNLCVVTLTNVFYPSIYRSLSEGNIDYSKLKKIVWAFIGITVFVALSLILITPLVFKYFIGPRFQEGQKYAILLTIGFSFWAIYNVFLVFLLNIKRNKLIMAISIVGMGLSVVSNFFLVRYFGALGATYTSIAVYFIMAFVTIYFVHKYYDLSKILGFHRSNLSKKYA